MAGFESSPSEFHRAADDDVVAEFQMDSVDANAADHQVALTLQYPGIPPIRVSLSPGAVGVHGDAGRGPGLRLGTHARIALEVDVIEVDGVRLTLNSNADDSGTVKGAAIEELEPVRS
jgi:hypothetical protein